MFFCFPPILTIMHLSSWSLDLQSAPWWQPMTCRNLTYMYKVVLIRYCFIGELIRLLCSMWTGLWRGRQVCLSGTLITRSACGIPIGFWRELVRGIQPQRTSNGRWLLDEATSPAQMPLFHEDSPWRNERHAEDEKEQKTRTGSRLWPAS